MTIVQWENTCHFARDGSPPYTLAALDHLHTHDEYDTTGLTSAEVTFGSVATTNRVLSLPAELFQYLAEAWERGSKPPQL